MSVRILFFASLREVLGTSFLSLDLPADVATVGALRDHLAARGGEWKTLVESKSLRAAVNQRMVDGSAAIASGDEVAFFPPVTGG